MLSLLIKKVYYYSDALDRHPVYYVILCIFVAYYYLVLLWVTLTDNLVLAE